MINTGIGIGYSCCFCFLDIDECSVSPSVCHVSATCQNTAGSYQCICNFGLAGDGKICYGKVICVDVNYWMCRHAEKDYYSTQNQANVYRFI